jgi:pyruvate formate lyase activating enzyme
MDNKRVLENFEPVYREFYHRRPEVPVLGATTLLLPHYIDSEEVEVIAEFIANLDNTIPYTS